MALRNLHILMPGDRMGTTSLRPLPNPEAVSSDKFILDFANKASQEWESWIQRQGMMERQAPELDRCHVVSTSACWSENFSSNPEGVEEGMNCPSSYSSPCFLFDESSSELEDRSFPLDDPSFIFDDAFLLLDDQSLQLGLPARPRDEQTSQSSPSPKLEPIIQYFPEVAEAHSGQPSTAEARSPTWQGLASPDSLPWQLEGTSTPALSPSSAPFHSGKQKHKKGKSSKDSGVPKTQRRRGYTLNSHNEIEKRYRTGINECIDRLRQATPFLVQKNNEYKFDEEDDGSITEKERDKTWAKDGKGDVLIRALEYIKYLEANASRMCNEIVALKTRLRTFEELAVNGPVSLDDARLLPPA